MTVLVLAVALAGCGGTVTQAPTPAPSVAPGTAIAQALLTLTAAQLPAAATPIPPTIAPPTAVPQPATVTPQAPTVAPPPTAAPQPPTAAPPTVAPPTVPLPTAIPATATRTAVPPTITRTATRPPTVRPSPTPLILASDSIGGAQQSRIVYTELAVGSLYIEVESPFPRQGKPNGDGVARVLFEIFNANNQRVHRLEETMPRYCAMGGNDCNYVFAQHNNRWPNGTLIQNGTYTVKATIFFKAGGSTESDEYSFRIQR